MIVASGIHQELVLVRGGFRAVVEGAVRRVGGGGAVVLLRDLPGSAAPQSTGHPHFGQTPAASTT
jgi:hypothetical protein